MTIFHIPSWYPFPQGPYSGIFIKEMIEAYATFYSGDTCFITNFHQLQYDIKLREPLQSFKQLIRYTSLSSPKEITHSANLFEYQNKLLTGAKILFGPLINSQLAIAEKHLELLIKRKTIPDIIHAHVCYPAGVIAEKLSTKFNMPYVISEQSGTELLKDAFEKYQLKDQIMDAFNHAKKISALSTFHKNELGKLNLNNISLIPNLINETVFKPDTTISNSEFNFFTLALIHESKGIKDLLFAIEKVVKMHDKIKIKIGGTGNQENEFKELAKSLQIASWIEWVGPLTRAQAAQSFQKCDCFILPSKAESLGVVYIEAIACGKPLIATNCGGPADIVNDNNGLLVETGNIDAIADAMIYMIKHSKEYSSENIREDFLQRFSRKIIVRKVKEFYIEAMKA